MNINYQSDFKLLESSSINDTETPFRFTYRTGALGSVVAQFDGEAYTGCRRIDESTLLVIFESHGLSAGALEVRREYYLTDEDFASGVCHSVSVEKLDVTLTSGKSDEANAEVLVEVFPSFVKVADVGDILVDEVGSDTTKAMSQAAATLAFVQYGDSSLEEYFAYGVEFDTAVSSPTCTRIGNSAYHRTLPIQSNMRGCILNSTGEVVEYLPTGDWSSSMRDGSLGQVMVEIPAHYRKFVTDGTKQQVWLSERALDGYHYVPAFYVSAYEAAVRRSTLSLCSVVNTTTEYRGGNNNSANDSTDLTLLGRPVTNLPIGLLHTYARRHNSSTAEWNCYTYLAHKAIYWLYTVEYASLNSQADYTSQLTADGYRQGGLGLGATTLSYSEWSAMNNAYPLIPCGYTDSLGNGTGELLYTAADGDGIDFSIYASRYRGIENPFGHLWQFVVGVVVNHYSSASTSSLYSSVSRLYCCEDPSNFAFPTSCEDSGYSGYEYLGDLSRFSDNYVSAMIFGESGCNLPSATGGSSSTYCCDGFLTDTILDVPCCAYVGGAASGALTAGLTNFAVDKDLFDDTASYIGTRLCFHPNN
ncbi:MAG: hypothetical protein SNI45_02605 [Rikenellaceae bacterium]